MTSDTEREAQTRLLGIRARDKMCSIDAGTLGEQACKIDRRELLRLLDEARADKTELLDTDARSLQLITDARAEVEHMRSERNEGYAKFHAAEVEIVDLRDDNRRLRLEIDQLRASPGDDAMEIARQVWRQINEARGIQDTTPRSVEPAILGAIARAIEAAAADARAKAIEEAAQKLDEMSVDPRVSQAVQKSLPYGAAAIRALADRPPQGDPVPAAMRQLKEWSCPEHGSFVVKLDGSRRCNFDGCSWTLPPSSPWRDIATAPKDGTFVLWRLTRWKDDDSSVL